MAKGTGLIGNFKGKVGNTVGYKLAASNNGQTQGIRVYQPIVKNPKTAAQAEQRAKLAPINAFYRGLKMVIDRGNEGLPYGNKSRLAWLKKAFHASKMPWIVKGGLAGWPLAVEVTKGSLPGILFTPGDDEFSINCPGLVAETSLATEGALATALLAAYPSLKAGDQITIVTVGSDSGVLATDIRSFLMDTTSVKAITGFTADANNIKFASPIYEFGGTVIVSREGDNGEHLRSTSSIVLDNSVTTSAPYNDTSKSAAIESYQSSAASNSDWAEESIQ